MRAHRQALQSLSQPLLRTAFVPDAAPARQSSPWRASSSASSITRSKTTGYSKTSPISFWRKPKPNNHFCGVGVDKHHRRTGMTKRIAILVLAMGMGIGLASRMTTVALAQGQDDKMQSDSKVQGDDKTQGDEKMKSDSMAGEKMDHNGKTMKKRKESSKKDSMSHDKVSDQDKMDHPQ